MHYKFYTYIYSICRIYVDADGVIQCDVKKRK